MSDWIARGKEVLDIEIDALRQVQERMGAAFAEAVMLLGRCQGRVVITGIGKSGLVGRKIAATLSSTGTPSFFLHPVEGAHGDLGAIRPDDAVIAISYSGKSEELNAILPTLKALGTPIIALTSGLTTPMANIADVVLDCSIPREACPMNLAPTSSTTATLALGDALAVCLIDLKSFTANDFKKFHPAGALGQRLSLSVADIMHSGNLPVTQENASLGDALAALDTGGVGAVVILDAQGTLAGILTDGDIRRMVIRGGVAVHEPVRSFMTPSPMRCQPEHSAAQVMDMMEQKMVTVLPVVNAEDHLVGIIHLHDLLGKGSVKFTEQR